MSQRWLFSLLAVAAAAPAVAGPNYRYVHRPDVDTYFGHVSYCELENDADDPRVLRAEGAQPASVNLPLQPGDTLQTTPGRRCEAQFDTGTLLRLDQQSGVWIETILARSLTTNDKLTNLHLQAGRLNVLYRDYDSQEVFQILTPNAAVKLGRAAVVDVRLTEDGETVVEVERGQAALLYGPSAEKTRTRKLRAGERVTIGRDDRLTQVARSRDGAKDAFGDWNREMNERFVALHSGKSALPKPIERFPRSVIYFAQRYADPYGEWIWSELYGYAWRPYLSRDEGWRPYQQGRWVPMSGRLFWVPEEPWGWVPYHLGLWHWDRKHGWVWLPGSAFAPAWVTWSMCDDFRYFRPLTLWDWSLRYNRGYRYRFFSIGDPCGLYPGWFDQRDVRVVVVTEQAQAPAPAIKPNPADEGGPSPIRKVPDLPLLPLPGELDKLAKKAEVAIRHGDPEVMEAVERTTRGGVPARVEKPMLAEAKGVAESQPASERFRDWNADVRAARNVGGHVVYSSVTNMVRCDSCSRPLINFDFVSRSMEAGRGSGNSGGGSDNSSGSSGGSSGTGSMAGIAASGSSGGASMAGLASGERKN